MIEFNQMDDGANAVTKDKSDDASASAFWLLDDERDALQAELKSLTGAGGQMRGISLLGWQSQTRKRAHAVIDELSQTQQQFERAQRDFSNASRARVAALTSSVAPDEVDELKALRVQINETFGDLTSVRAKARAMLAGSRNSRKRDESSLVALLRKAAKD